MTTSLDILDSYNKHRKDCTNPAQVAAATLKAIYLWLREHDTSLEEIQIEYEGSGDSGQIEDIDGVHDDYMTLELPVSLYTLPARLSWDPETKSFQSEDPRPATVEQALDYLGWDLAYGTHPGFEINDGGRGTVTITHSPEDPSLIKVTLDHKEFYTESTDWCDEF